MQKIFYIPAKEQELLKKLEEILKREGSNLSQWIREQAEPYVRLHEPGNPQQRLDIIMELVKPYRANQCNVAGCGAVPVAQAWFIKCDIPVLLCADHLQAKQRLVDAKNWEPIIRRVKWIKIKKGKVT